MLFLQILDSIVHATLRYIETLDTPMREWNFKYIKDTYLFFVLKALISQLQINCLINNVF